MTKDRSYYTDRHVYSDYFLRDRTCFASKKMYFIMLRKVNLREQQLMQLLPITINPSSDLFVTCVLHLSVVVRESLAGRKIEVGRLSSSLQKR